MNTDSNGLIALLQPFHHSAGPDPKKKRPQIPGAAAQLLLRSAYCEALSEGCIDVVSAGIVVVSVGA
jgi:hypothetical protein